MKNQTLPINDSFCALPWVHQMVRGDGKLKLCCVSHDPVGNFNDMEADWNNQTMRDVRASMIAGRPVEACRECMVQEVSSLSDTGQMIGGQIKVPSIESINP
jgi:hypothetical protein